MLNYINYCKCEKGYTPRALETIQTTCRLFSDWCNGRTVDFFLCRQYVMSLSQRGLSGKTINNYVGCLRQWFNFKLMCGEVSENPWYGVARFRQSRPLPLCVTPGQIAECAHALDMSQPEQKYAYYVMCVLFGTGMRAEEAVNLRWSDIDFASGFLRVWGKGQKERQIAITDDISDLMKDWRDEHKGSTHALCDVLGNAIDSYRLRQLIFIALRPLPSALRHPHVLRHGYATMLLNDGVNLHVISRQLGHASVNTTQIYLNLNYEDLKQQCESAHPRYQSIV